MQTINLLEEIRTIKRCEACLLALCLTGKPIPGCARPGCGEPRKP